MVVFHIYRMNIDMIVSQEKETVEAHEQRQMRNEMTTGAAPSLLSSNFLEASFTSGRISSESSFRVIFGRSSSWLSLVFTSSAFSYYFLF